MQGPMSCVCESFKQCGITWTASTWCKPWRYAWTVTLFRMITSDEWLKLPAPWQPPSRDSQPRRPAAAPGPGPGLASGSVPLTVTGSGARLQDVRVTVAESEAPVTVAVRHSQQVTVTMTVAGLAAVTPTVERPRPTWPRRERTGPDTRAPCHSSSCCCQPLLANVSNPSQARVRVYPPKHTLHEWLWSVAFLIIPVAKCLPRRLSVLVHTQQQASRSVSRDCHYYCQAGRALDPLVFALHDFCQNAKTMKTSR